MWKLNPPSKELLNWYEETMLPGLKDRILKSPNLPDRIKQILIPFRIDDSILKHLLGDFPEQSKNLSDRLMYDMTKAISMLNLLGQTYTLKDLRSHLKKVFDYDGQISKNKKRSYKIALEQGRNTCTYCNRLYTFTVVVDESDPTPKCLRANNKTLIVRPQLDHWFDKADYPLLSLNLYNLIPSCPICNSSVKGTARFSFSTHIHPYLYNRNDPPFKFQLAFDRDDHLIIKIDDSQCTPQEKNMIRNLALKEIYEYHGEHEGRDLYLWSQNNSYDYLLNTLKKLKTDIPRTPEDIYRMFFGAEYFLDDTLNRPFSKLKRDLLEYLGIKPI